MRNGGPVPAWGGDRRGAAAADDRRLSHRGPDGDGFHVEPGVGLGHRAWPSSTWRAGSSRCSTRTAPSPSCSTAKSTTTTPCAPSCRRKATWFRNRCDTEAIIHAWESWGPDCLAHLSGMFAFALWDRNKQTLFLARDRLGKKPLHYMRLPGGGLAFASELAALGSVPGHRHRIDPAAVDDFFAYGYIPDPGTIFEGIHKLPAAHYLLLQPGAPDAAPQRYWGLSPTPARQRKRTPVPELLAHLRRSTAARLVADVPLGAFLSGRGGFQRGGRPGRPDAGRAARHLHHRHRRPRRRAALRGVRRGALRHGAPHGLHHLRLHRRRAHAGADLRRAVRRQLRRADHGGVRPGPAARHRGAVRRRRRRGAGRLPALPVAPARPRRCAPTCRPRCAAG